MRPRGEDRGQAVQVGAVLLFGFLIVSLSTYQATVVPSQTEAVEADHSRSVRADMVELRNSVVRAAEGGRSYSTAVDLGPQYPARAVFVNPGPASGRLESFGMGATGRIRVANASAADVETADYWDGSTVRTFDTRAVAYRPGYNRYRNAPDTVYENSVLYNAFRSGTAGAGQPRTVGNAPVTFESDQTLVRGRTLSLVALQGELSESGTGTVPVDPEATSPATNTVAVRAPSASAPVTLTLPTRLSASTWERLLADQRVSNGGYVQGIAVDGGELELTLLAEEGGTPVTYSLRLAGVGLRQGAVTTAGTYATIVDGAGGEVTDTGQRELVVEVRDRFNNPVPGVAVSVGTGGAGPQYGSVAPGTVRTDEDGHAAFSYDPEDVTGSSTESFEVGFGTADPEHVTFEFTVVDADAGGGGGEDFDVSWESPGTNPGPVVNPAEDCSAVPCSPLALRTETDPPTGDVPVGFESSDPGVASLVPDFASTDASGEATTGLTFGDVGSATVYAHSGQVLDTLAVGTYFRTDFEDDTSLGPVWEAFGGGTVEVQTDGNNANSGSHSVRIAGGTSASNGVCTGSVYDTSGASLVVVEYWAQEDDGSGGPETGEDLHLEYRADGGSWTEVDVMAADDGGSRDRFERRARIASPDAFHSGFRLRFRRDPASGSDEWFVDDVRLSVLGTRADGTAPASQSCGGSGGGGGGSNAVPSVTIDSITPNEAGRSGTVKTVDVSFTPDDSDGNLDNATVVVRIDGTEQGREEDVDITGRENQTVNVNVDNANAKGTVEVTVEVFDSAGKTDSETKNENQA
jgi:hypothetical protein